MQAQQENLTLNKQSETAFFLCSMKLSTIVSSRIKTKSAWRAVSRVVHFRAGPKASAYVLLESEFIIEWGHYIQMVLWCQAFLAIWHKGFGDRQWIRKSSIPATKNPPISRGIFSVRLPASAVVVSTFAARWALCERTCHVYRKRTTVEIFLVEHFNCLLSI
jgi:hypothetical protein